MSEHTDTHADQLLEEREAPQPDSPWQTIVWDDPVNLMSYVTYVFRKHFGYPEPLARSLMLAVHNRGHAVVAEGAKDAMQMHVEALHEYGLWATMRPTYESGWDD